MGEYINLFFCPLAFFYLEAASFRRMDERGFDERMG